MYATAVSTITSVLNKTIPKKDRLVVRVKSLSHFVNTLSYFSTETIVLGKYNT